MLRLPYWNRILACIPKGPKDFLKIWKSEFERLFLNFSYLPPCSQERPYRNQWYPPSLSGKNPISSFWRVPFGNLSITSTLMETLCLKLCSLEFPSSRRSLCSSYQLPPPIIRPLLFPRKPFSRFTLVSSMTLCLQPLSLLLLVVSD